MSELNRVDTTLLEVIAGMKDGKAEGAFNIRKDSGCAGRVNTENVTITTKTAGQVSGCILDLSIWHSPVFLLNSCLDRFSAPSHKRVGTLYPEVTGSVCLVP